MIGDNFFAFDKDDPYGFYKKLDVDRKLCNYAFFRLVNLTGDEFWEKPHALWWEAPKLIRESRNSLTFEEATALAAKKLYPEHRLLPGKVTRAWTLAREMRTPNAQRTHAEMDRYPSRRSSLAR